MFKRTLIAASLTVAALASAQAMAVTGGGASLPAALYKGSANSILPANFSYLGTGSGTGKTAFLTNNSALFSTTGSVHFAGSDSILSAAEINTYNLDHNSAGNDVANNLFTPNVVPGINSIIASLTNLYNRREFERRLDGAIDSLDAGGPPCALLYLDLDQFKLINDTSGHYAGDQLLAQLAALLAGLQPEGSLVARLGGDEFAILCENISESQAMALAERVRTGIDGYVFSWEDRNYTISASIGVVMMRGPGLSQRSLLANADTACYMAKERGRNRVHLFSEQDSETTQRRSEMEWAGRIRQALSDGRFLLHFQELVPLWEGERSEGVHMEMLIRLRDEKGALVPPGAFIPAAERFGLMPAIDRWVVVGGKDGGRLLLAKAANDAQAAAIGPEHPASSSPLLLLSPLMHGAGQFTAVIHLLKGGTLALLPAPKFDADAALDEVRRIGARGIFIVGDAFALPLADRLDARGVVSPTERQSFIARVRDLAKAP